MYKLEIKSLFFLYLNKFNNRRKYILKKYIYTVNHKRIGLNYFYFSMVSGLSGAVLATMIRLELATPGTPFFKGDSLRYLQVITAHALIMVFFVVVPILFGGFANFLLPYHVGSKDVAFPRLNSFGFWLQPCGFLLVAKVGFLRPSYWRYTRNYPAYFDLQENKNTVYFDVNLNKNSIIYNNIVTFFNGLLEKLPACDLYCKGRIDISFINFFFILTDSSRFKYLKISGVDTYRYVSPDYKLTTVLGKVFFLKQYLVWEKTWHTSYVFDPKFTTQYNFVNFLPKKLLDLSVLFHYSDNFWYFIANRFFKKKKKVHKRYVNVTETVSGWTFITPLSCRLKYTISGAQDLLIFGVLLVGVSTSISIVNLLVTRRTLSMPGLRNRRSLMPFISISILLMLRTLAIITPVLGSSMIMLLTDRHWQTYFFDFTYGGDPLLFQHLFWFFGHPEVYVLMIPGFGIINQVLAHNNFRRLSSKNHMVWAIYIMTYMGFLVWGHHMYLVGLDHRLRSFFSTITIMISLPATIKIVNWTFTLLNGSLFFDSALIAAIFFILFFIVGGLTGMWLSHICLNICMHDTYYVVAHFHIMLSGAAMMSIFCGFYYYFNVFFGIKYSRLLSYLHLVYYTAGQWVTFLPLFWLGYAGLPRRVHDYPTFFMGWQGVATIGHFVTLISIFFFFWMLFDSHYEKKTYRKVNLGVPHFSKRIAYYIFKINFLALSLKTYKYLPNMKIRIFLIENLNDFNCFESVDN